MADSPSRPSGTPETPPEAAPPANASGAAPAGPATGGERYLVTARKYRPQTFGDLVAQEHVAETLRNAILSGRLAHAYLFSGPRGVGKTTAARLVAKAVNCQTPLAQRPDAEPCRTCEACRTFEEGRALNVIEMDAASNNGVDDVRELRETVRIPPQGADKKVYILDEVHMFSAAAFNALLKTLEEPPPYALFVFATTEPHKVLPTILSRTQRFDFRRIQVPEIVSRLREVCQAEGITADEDSLVLLARKGDGALRDALSLFDQAVSLVGTDLQIGPLREALGVVEEDVFFAVTDRAAQGDRAGLILLVDGLVRRGYDLAEFVDGLGEHLRDLMVTRSTGRADLVEGTDATRERYANAAADWAEADLLHLLMLTEACASDLRATRQPRLVVELALVKMATLESAADLRVLIDRLGRIEAALQGGARLDTGAAPPEASGAPATRAPASGAGGGAQNPSPRGGARDAGGGSPAAPSRSATPEAQASTPGPPAPPPGLPAANAPRATAEAPAGYAAPPLASAPALTPPPAPHAASGAPTAAPTATAPAAAPGASGATPSAHPPTRSPLPLGEGQGEGRSEQNAATDRDTTFEPDAAPEQNTATDPVISAPHPAPTAPEADTRAQPHDPSPSRQASGGGLFGAPALSLRGGTSGDGATAALAAPPADASEAAPAPEADPHFGVSIPRVAEVWPDLVRRVRAERGPRLFAMVASAKPERLHRGALEIAVPTPLAQGQLDAEAEYLADALGALAGQDLTLRFVVQQREAGETAAPDDPFETLKQLRQTDPVVRALFEKLGAEIVWN